MKQCVAVIVYDKGTNAFDCNVSTFHREYTLDVYRMTSVVTEVCVYKFVQVYRHIMLMIHSMMLKRQELR